MAFIIVNFVTRVAHRKVRLLTCVNEREKEIAFYSRSYFSCTRICTCIYVYRVMYVFDDALYSSDCLLAEVYVDCPSALAYQ